MNCLCCNKEIEIEESRANSGWHKRCIKNFFGTEVMPSIELDEEAIKKLATDNINRGFTVPGVQKKLSLHLSKISKRESRLTLIDYPAGYILKPQTKEYKAMPELEYITMKMAEKTGIEVVPHALIKDSKGEYNYITKRVDRTDRKNQIEEAGIADIKNRLEKEQGMLAMEDFCQLSERLTADKYKASYEKCADIINQYSNRPGIDKVEFFIRLLFCFVSGNSDMHLKNFSLIEEKEGNRKFVLSKAYDLLPVNLILPEDREEMALTLNGKKANIKRADFEKIGERLGINEKTIDRIIKKIITNKPVYFEIIENVDIFPELKEEYMELIEKRIARLI